MAFSIKNDEADRLVRQLTVITGENLTEAVTISIRERLARFRAKRGPHHLADELDRIAKRCAALPLLDERSADEILGYDDRGLPR